MISPLDPPNWLKHLTWTVGSKNHDINHKFSHMIYSKNDHETQKNHMKSLKNNKIINFRMIFFAFFSSYNPYIHLIHRSFSPVTSTFFSTEAVVMISAMNLAQLTGRTLVSWGAKGPRRRKTMGKTMVKTWWELGKCSEKLWHIFLNLDERGEGDDNRNFHCRSPMSQPMKTIKIQLRRFDVFFSWCSEFQGWNPLRLLGCATGG